MESFVPHMANKTHSLPQQDLFDGHKNYMALPVSTVQAGFTGTANARYQ